jgi:hypothetical protein
LVSCAGQTQVSKRARTTMPAVARAIRVGAVEITVELTEEFEAGTFISFKTCND